MTLQQTFDRAVQLHQAGRLTEAEAGYRHVLRQEPNHPEAVHLLGVIAHQVGRNDLAAPLIRRAIAINPNDAAACNNLGNAVKAVGQFDEAISAYHQAIALRPDYPEAHSNLGTALQEKGQLAEAVAACRHAISLKPNMAEGHNNLGNALTKQGQLDEAVNAFREAIAFKPTYPEAHFNLGNAMRKQGRVDEAIAAYRRAIALRHNFPEVDNSLGNALRTMGQVDEAIAAYRQAVTLMPGYADAHSNLGNALWEAGRLDEAIDACRRAIAIRPDLSEAHCNLGNVLSETGQWDEAIVACRGAIAIRPDYAEAYCNLGNALRSKGELDRAIAAYRQATTLNPQYPEAHCNLGSVLKDTGQLDAALTSLRTAVVLNPASDWMHSNLVYTLQFHPAYDPRTIHDELAEWNRRHAEPLKPQIRPHLNDRDPDRRLRIGYVSPDFRRHPVGRYLLPLLEHHDHRQVEVFCYASQYHCDDLTDRLAKHADVWRNASAVSDDQLAGLIRSDQIDILVDLSLHMAGNRLLVFARKPAPVQVSWLGYPGSTGLTAIDYRITDPYLDPFDDAQGGPPGGNDAFYSEESIRLPEAACYRPVDGTPAVAHLPAMSRGFVTFGCLNNFCKVTDAATNAWLRVLHAVPNSHLLIHAHEGQHRQRARDRLSAAGFDPLRIRFVGFGGGGQQYFEIFHEIDICLDPFPYGGGTTTCESLWMGVPVVTLAGTSPFSRMGLGVLTCIGLPELVAKSKEGYIQTAVDLATDLPRLSALRTGMRQCMQESPLMNAGRFARNLEHAYRQMWRRWCSQRNEIS